MSYTVQIVHSGSAVETYLAVDCNSASTSVTLNDATGWPSPTGSQIAYGTIKPAQSGESKFTYTSRSGNVLSGVTWSTDGTTSSASYTAGSSTVVRHGFTAVEATEANDVVRNTLGRIDAAEQILVSDSSTTMAKLAVAASRFVGRKASGSIAAMTGTEAGVVLGLGTAATKDTGYTASKIPVLTGSPGTPDGTKFLRDDGTWASAAAALTAGTTNVTTSETRAANSYGDLSTVQAVTVTTGTKALVAFSSTFRPGASTAPAAIAVAVTGATTLTADNSHTETRKDGPANGQWDFLGRTVLLTGLTAGSNVFTLKFRSYDNTTTITFLDRFLTVVDMGS